MSLNVELAREMRRQRDEAWAAARRGDRAGFDLAIGRACAASMEFSAEAGV